VYKLIIPEYPLCKVIDPGDAYTAYPCFISKFFPELSVLYSYVELQLPIKNKTYLLLGEHEHEDNFAMLCVILDEEANQLFIVEKRGIKIIGDNNA